MPRPALLLLLAIALGAVLVQSSRATTQDRVIIQPRTVVLVRSGKISRDFPERKRATVRYPIVRGLSDAAMLQRVRDTLAIKNVFGSTLEEYRQDAWLSEFDYKVNYNKNFLLDIEFSQTGMGAYPDTQTKHFLVSLKSGMIVKAADAFKKASLATLAEMADRKLKTEVREIVKEVGSDKESDAESKRSLQEQLGQLTFAAENLDELQVSDRGITFLYDAGFPHVIQALQPNGRYFFSYAELRAHIRPDGPLGIFN